MIVRQPAVAGTFYPEEPELLKSILHDMLAQAKYNVPMPKAIIVPHAGYIYSGPIAASAYASLSELKDQIKKIVMLGPAHRVYFRGIAYDPVEGFLTPLGEIPQNKELVEKISSLPFVHALSEAHREEHCLEVQWPFCQMIFQDFSILPLVVGETNKLEVSHLLEKVWGQEDTLIIISSDLSHYLPYEEAISTDIKTCLAIDTLESDSIAHHSACGYFPVRGFLHYTQHNKIYGRLLDYRNSGDTAGDKNRVVGYAAYHFYEDLRFGDHCPEELLYLAREAINMKAKDKKAMIFDFQQYHDLLQIRVPCFVTINKHKQLRGCMGSLLSREYLGDNIIHNALRAGFEDPRFPKIEPEELKDLEISISILSPIKVLSFSSEEDLKRQLIPGIDGLILQYKTHQATFLPSVWDMVRSKEEFMEHLKLKMGLAADFWSDEMQALSYTVEKIE